jgi:hypothetical protein
MVCQLILAKSHIHRIVRLPRVVLRSEISLFCLYPFAKAWVGCVMAGQKPLLLQTEQTRLTRHWDRFVFASHQ